jgi:hypothetical protein
VSVAFPFFITPLSVNSVDMPHAAGQVPQGSFHKQVVMIGHKAEPVNTNFPQLSRFGKQLQKSFFVF